MFKTASKFIKRDLKGQVNFKAVSAYLHSIGFAVILYDCTKNNDILKKYGLLEFSKTVKGFTVYRKDLMAVFIDDSLACEEKLCVLLHETGHIVLGHGDKKDIQDARFLEMEADAFAYAVLRPKRDRSLLKTITICMMVFCAVTGLMVLVNATNHVHLKEAPVFVASSIDEASVEERDAIVYVTPAGKKYHRSVCRYIQGKNHIALTLEEATGKYEDCLVCKP